MPRRNFTDRHGVQWRVWNTVPSPRTPLNAEYAGGWLTFECDSSLRRLAPVPDGWDDLDDSRLHLLCQLAREVPRHTPNGLRSIAAPPAAEQARELDGGTGTAS